MILHGLIQKAKRDAEDLTLRHVRIDQTGRVWRPDQHGEWKQTTLILASIDDRVALLMGELATPEDHWL